MDQNFFTGGLSVDTESSVTAETVGYNSEPEWNKSILPIVCGRCGKTINKNTPYSLYFNPVTKVQVCEDCYKIETAIKSKTWPDCPIDAICFNCPQYPTSKDQNKNCSTLRTRHNTLRRMLYAARKTNQGIA